MSFPACDVFLDQLLASADVIRSICYFFQPIAALLFSLLHDDGGKVQIPVNKLFIFCEVLRTSRKLSFTGRKLMKQQKSVTE